MVAQSSVLARRWADSAPLRAQQWGLITSAQLQRLGVNGSSQLLLRRRGLLVSVARGVMREPRPPADDLLAVAQLAWVSAAPGSAPEERLSAARPDYVVTAYTALALHGLAAPPVETLPLLAVTGRFQHRQTATYAIVPRRAELSWDDVAVLDGLPVFTPAAAIRDVAAHGGARFGDDLADYFTTIAGAAADRPDQAAIDAAIAATGIRLDAPSPSSPLPPLLARKWADTAALRTAQWGLITSVQLQQQGVTRSDHVKLRDAGLVVPVANGVMREADRPGEGALAAAQLAWVAAVRDSTPAQRLSAPRPDCVVTGTTALAIHGLGQPGQGLPQLAITKAPKNGGRTTTTARYLGRSTALSWDDVDIVDGLPVFTPAAAIRDLGQDSRGRLVDDLAGYFADIAIAAANHPDRDAIVAAIAACGARLRTVVCDARAVLDRVYRTAGVSDDLLAATIWGGQWQRRFTADRVQHIVATALSVAVDTIAGRAGDDLSTALVYLLERNGQARKCVVADCEWWAVEQDRCSAHAIQRRRERVLADPSGVDSSTTATPRRSGHGWWGHIDDDGETIACHECGERFRALTRTHLETHDLTAREYKQRHGIEQRIGLVSTEVRERQQHQVATNSRYSERFRRNPNAPRLTDLPSALLEDQSR
ncbi:MULTISPECIES: MucR family transcriptional regulator [Gordonia]|uniref:MucR family transcriptional regulator n=1 Tax=Gordonia TaxID=2053 RepID=UPI001111BCE5|nr:MULTISPECIES: MucR family transcriptional regulator [unclassified Gordonia (in: high G+C Gram-positive bacteria)]